jgi:2-methylisocitrate lyase-like PEP mutase family enzyme
MNASSKLRSLLRENRPLFIPAVFNALSARIALIAGYEAVWLSNTAVSASLIAKPDLGLLTATEVAMVTGYVAAAIDGPVLADAEAGFGNAINAMRTTEQFVKAGAAGMQISDRLASPNAARGAAAAAPIEEAVGKLRAVARTRDELDADFVIVVRLQVPNGMAADVEELLERVRAYADAGVDAVMPGGLSTPEMVERFCGAAACPVWWDAATMPSATQAFLEKMRIKSVLCGHEAVSEAASGMFDYFCAFREGDIVVERRVTEELAGHPLGDLHTFVGFPAIRKLEEAYLPRAEVLRKYESSVGIAP